MRCRTAKRRPPEAAESLQAEIGDADSGLELFWLLAMALLGWLHPRQDLVLEDLLLHYQLAILTRPTRTRPRARLRSLDKLLWIVGRRWCAGWREHLAIVTPDTVVRWHRQHWHLFWRWRSRARGGRPHLSREIRDFISTMSRENRLWDTERIRGELLKLGIFATGSDWAAPCLRVCCMSAAEVSRPTVSIRRGSI
jgi:hypothetical protein